MRKTISMSTTELLEKLSTDLNELLRLRDLNHYRSGRPDQQNDDVKQDEYEANHTDHDSAWEAWADAMHDNNNRMGSYVGDAQLIVKALQRWWLEVKPAGED